MFRIFFPLLIASYGIARAQEKIEDCNYTITGKVVDTHDKSPLSYAEIYIEELQKGVVSDSLGNFEIKLLCTGTYTLQCKHVGCNDIFQTIKLKENASVQINMEHHWKEIEEIEISTQKIKKLHSQSEIVLSKENREKQSGKTLADALQEISGVNILRTGNDIAKPVIHGMYGNRILLFNNQTRQEDQQWGSEHAPNIDPFAIDKIILIKGAAAVQYGSDALGGVIKLEQTQTLHRLEGGVATHAYTNGRGALSSAYLKGNFRQQNKWFYKVQGTLKRHGDYKAPNYFLSNTGQKEQSFSTYLHYQTWRHAFKIYYSLYRVDNGILRASHIGNTTDLENAIQRKEPLFVYDFSYKINNPKQEVAHHNLNFYYQLNLKSSNKIEAIYAFQANERKEFDIRRNRNDKRPAIRLNLKTHNFDLSYQQAQTQKQKKIGLQIQYQFNDNVLGTGFRPIIPNYDAYNAGFFYIEKMEIKKWKIERGARYDFKYIDTKRLNRLNMVANETFDFHNVALFFGFKYDASTQFQISTNIASAFRPPNVAELLSDGIHQSVASIEEGNINLKTERSIKWVTTLDFKNKNKVLIFQITPYVNYINDYIFLKPQTTPRLTVRGAFPVFNYQKTNAVIMGSDFDFTISIHKNITLQQQSSLLYGRDISEKSDLIFMPPINFKQSLRYDFIPKKYSLYLQVENRVVIRQHWFPKGVDFIPPPQGYSIFNFYAGITLPKNKSNWELIAQIENIFDQSYRDYLNRFRYFVDNTGINFSIKLKYNFFKP